MNFFFYGTLMDEDVRALVVGRRAPPSACRPAVLAGYRRVFRDGAAYPILVRARASEGDGVTRVDGCLVAGLSKREISRLKVFEGEEYELTDLPVRTPSRTGQDATGSATGPSMKSPMGSPTGPFVGSPVGSHCDDTPVQARVFMAKPWVTPTPVEWTLEGWRRRHKSRYLARLRAVPLWVAE